MSSLLGWHDPMRKPCTFRLERVSCGKENCRTCQGTKPAHGPYWYAYWETGGRAKPKMQKRYIGRAGANASEEELRALFERRQQARADAARRRSSSSGRSSWGGRSSTSGSGSTSNGSTSNDYFNSRRAPPIEVDFQTIGAKPGDTFKEARRAYYSAAQQHHTDRGGDAETMKRVNVAWERIKQHFERQKRRQV